MNYGSGEPLCFIFYLFCLDQDLLTWDPCCLDIFVQVGRGNVALSRNMVLFCISLSMVVVLGAYISKYHSFFLLWRLGLKYELCVAPIVWCEAPIPVFQGEKRERERERVTSRDLSLGLFYGF